MKHEKKAEIAGIIARDYNFRPGSTAYLGKHSHVSTRMWKGLGKQGQLAYEKKAQKWNKESPPRDVQKR